MCYDGSGTPTKAEIVRQVSSCLCGWFPALSHEDAEDMKESMSLSMNDSAKIPCPVCDSSENKAVWKQDAYCMVRCAECGLFYQSLRLSEQELLRRYQKEHLMKKAAARKNHRSVDSRRSNSLEEMPEKYLFDLRNTLTKIEKFKQKGSLLDIGFGSASFLLVARDMGWNVQGVEVSESAVADARKKHSLDLWCGKTEDAPFPYSSFDVVAIRHTLEHVYELGLFFRKVRSILKDHGLLLVELPNIASLEHRTKSLLAAAHLRRPPWENMYLPEHLYYFSPRTFSRLMEKHGFTIDAWETYSHYMKHSRLGYLLGSLRHLLKMGNKMRFFATKQA